MKAIYTSPLIRNAGGVVQETKSTPNGNPEFVGQLGDAGGVGFNL
jgi:hypothetical protein